MSESVRPLLAPLSEAGGIEGESAEDVISVPDVEGTEPMEEAQDGEVEEAVRPIAPSTALCAMSG